MRRDPRRWRTSFGRFVSAVGVTRLCTQLAEAGHPVTPHAVYHWIGGRVDPRPAHARALVQLSGGRVRLADIYGQRVVREPDRDR